MPQTGVGSSLARKHRGRFLPPPGGTAKHLGRREEGDSCCPPSPGRGNRSGRETKSLVCVPLWWSFPLGIINRCDVVSYPCRILLNITYKLRETSSITISVRLVVEITLNSNSLVTNLNPPLRGTENPIVNCL